MRGGGGGVGVVVAVVVGVVWWWGTSVGAQLMPMYAGEETAEDLADYTPYSYHPRYNNHHRYNHPALPWTYQGWDLREMPGKIYMGNKNSIGWLEHPQDTMTVDPYTGDGEFVAIEPNQMDTFKKPAMSAEDTLGAYEDTENRRDATLGRNWDAMLERRNEKRGVGLFTLAFEMAQKSRGTRKPRVQAKDPSAYPRRARYFIATMG